MSIKYLNDACYLEMKAREEENEREALNSINEIIELYGDRLSLLWSMGDGEGGFVIAEICRLMVDKGHILPISEYDGSYKKIPINAKIREDVFVRDNYTCVYCGSRRSLCCDHIHPELHGGLAELSNLQTLCKSCNSTKSSKIL